PFGNGSEMNSWTALSKWRRNLPVRSRIIDIQKKVVKLYKELPDLSELIDKLKNDRRFYEVIDEKDEDLIHPDDLEYFHQTFNIPRIGQDVTKLGLFGKQFERRPYKLYLPSGENICYNGVHL
ncbi:33878_t:CDS:2, partial [Racocetra persica]